MTEHVFLKNSRIEEADIRGVIHYTAVGSFEWGEASTVTAIGTSVSYSAGPEFSLNKNLLEARIGFNPYADDTFHYLRMKDFEGLTFYVDADDQPELLPLAQRLYRVARIALATRNGRLNGSVEACSVCIDNTAHVKLVDSPYGLSGAVMAGTERLECMQCGQTRSVAK